MKVANKKCIRRLSMAHMKSVKNRNIITILAIALTTILFTALFTAGISMKEGFEQANFRQAGGYNHGSFKNLTQEQYDELKDDPLIKEYGDRMFVGMPDKEPFHKSHVEVSYCNAHTAEWMFCRPEEGRLPKEGTNEAATDTTVLALLGVEPVIGNEFTMTFNVDGTETTETFTLCGFWEYDETTVANHVLLPRSRAEEIFIRLGTKGEDGMTTFHNMDVMFRNASHIEENMEEILERHGYQKQNMGDADYIGIGVNWGYVSAQMGQSMDFSLVLALAGAVLLIILTGYLIINNIFRIAVANDVRFYGLLKTIGTTGRQIKRIIRLQAEALSLVGIPIGVVAGYLLGIAITRIVVPNMDFMENVNSLNPLIFVGAAAFSLITVFLSCSRPGRMAAKVSPIEALRYTEGYQSKKKIRRAKTGASVVKMAWANLGRSKSKTVLTVVSMSLAIVVLDMTYVFTGGFDMDRYLRRMTQDFILADASYFQPASHTWGYGSEAEEAGLEEEDIVQMEGQDGVIGGRTYGTITDMQELISEEWARKKYGSVMRGGLSGDNLDFYVNHILEQVENQRADDSVRLYGMEDFVLDKLVVLDGDVSRLKGEGNYVAAVYDTDDYDVVHEDWNWAKVGDRVTLRYVDQYEYCDPYTGEIYPEDMDLTGIPYSRRAGEYREETYEVAATVVIPSTLTYRNYGDDDFVMGADLFQKHTGTNTVMYYAFDCEDDKVADMEQYLQEYTEGEGAGCDYESKSSYAEGFRDLQNMYLLVGTAVSFVIGLIGVLNFLNAILTGILTRKKELAVLQSVGMTGRQLRKMLMTEGVIFAGSAVTVTICLVVGMGPSIGKVMESMFWFFSYRINLAPIFAVAPFFLLLGVAVPLISYRYVARNPVVERLREAE